MIIGWLASVYFAAGVNIQGFLSLMPFIQEEFQINRAQIGLYSTFYFFMATVTAMYMGRVVDRVGAKKGILFGTFSIGLIILAHTAAPVYGVLLGLAVFTGLGFSIITPSLSSVVIRQINAENRATSMGLIHAGGGLGGIVGAALLPWVATYAGWRGALWFSGILAVMIGFCLLKFFHEPKRDDKKQQADSTTFVRAFRELMKNKDLVAVCMLGLAFGVCFGAIPAHFTVYVTQDLSMSRTLGGVTFAVLQIGGVIGQTAWGRFSDKACKGNRQTALSMIGFCLTFISFVFAYVITRGQWSWPFVMIASFILGFISLGWPGLYFTTIAERTQRTLTGMGTGFALLFMRLGVVISSPVFGSIADQTGNYQNSFAVIGLIYLAFTSAFTIYGKVAVKAKSG